jgi:hypothetical protein
LAECIRLHDDRDGQVAALPVTYLYVDVVVRDGARHRFLLCRTRQDHLALCLLSDIARCRYVLEPTPREIAGFARAAIRAAKADDRNQTEADPGQH